MNCFICKGGNFSVNSLIKHLKVFHSVSESDEVRCGETTCLQAFTSLGNFRKHIKSQHGAEENCVVHPTKKQCFDSENSV